MKPKPIALHKTEGTYVPSRHDKRAHEPVAHGNLRELPVPDWLTPAQKTFWRDVLKRAPENILRHIDRELLIEYVELHDRYKQAVLAQRQLDRGKELPFLAKTKTGIAISPYLRVMNHCIIIMRALKVEMGFTPVSRVRLATGSAPDEPLDPMTGWGLFHSLRVVKGGKDDKPATKGNGRTRPPSE